MGTSAQTLLASLVKLDAPEASTQIHIKKA